MSEQVNKIEIGPEFQERMVGPFKAACAARTAAKIATNDLESATLKILLELNLSSDLWTIAHDGEVFSVYRIPQQQGHHGG